MKALKTISLFLQNTTLLQKILVLLPVSFLTTLDTMIYPLIALISMIAIDLATSLIAYFRKKRKRLGRPLTFNEYRYGVKSGGLRKTGIKFYQYMFMVIAVFILEVFAFQGPINFTVPLISLKASVTQFVIWTLTMIELKSIDENFKDAEGKTLISKIKDIFRYLKDLVKDLKSK